jgi:hypothetical protein
MSHNYDPAKEPCSPLFEPCVYNWSPEGPGGNSTLTENNEKGIQETKLFGVISLHQTAELGSQHDGFRQGIYGTNSVGDND